MKYLLISVVLFSVFFSCKMDNKQVPKKTISVKDTLSSKTEDIPFVWEGANIYFLLTDRFYNGNPENDINFDRNEFVDKGRGFMGGDIQGITKKINEGYFSELGINAIWLTPIMEQIHGSTDESNGSTYGYHGYWAKDWTSLDPNFGTKADLAELVKTAHNKGIRILLDVVLNHTGPVTEKDEVWPKEWVITEPICDYTNYKNTTDCTLTNNLPDVITTSNEPVELPDALLAKWKAEGRLSTELDELQLFFDRTGHPRAPRFYIIKWLTDYIHEFGIDGYRVDTVKHVNEEAWSELYKEAAYAFEIWKKKHPNAVLDDNPFYMMGEVYNYGISGGRAYDFGDKKIDYFNYGFSSLINFDLKNDAQKAYENIFSKYSKLLHTKLKGKSVVNYLTSHDDLQPFDKNREESKKTANILLLTPGVSQIYYGDETARNLAIDSTQGDAALHSFMNWEELDSLPSTKNRLEHWQKIGQFRHNHPAIGAGKHKRLAKKPYVFSRTYTDNNFKDKVVVGLELPKGKKSLWVKGFFGDGTKLYDTYSETDVTVKNGKVLLENDFEVALLELKRP